MTGNLDINNKRIYNLAQPNDNNQPTTKTYVDTYFLAKSGALMDGNLNLSNNRIINVGAPTSEKDGVNKEWADSTFLKLSGGRLNGNLTVPSVKIGREYNELVLNDINTRFIFVEKKESIYIQQF